MTSSEQFGEQLRSTLETHETDVKRLIETFGDLEGEFSTLVSEWSNQGMLNELEELGKALEHHEARLERVVRSLDEHKKVVQQPEDTSQNALIGAMQKARQRARQESHPPKQDKPEDEDPRR